MKRWLKKQILCIRLYIEENYQNEANSLVIWYAVCYALGALYYQVIPIEISSTWLVICLEAALLLLYLSRKQAIKFKGLTYILVFIIGICIAKAHALHQVNNIEDNIKGISYLNGQIKVLDKKENNRTKILLSNVNNFERELKGDFSISIRSNAPWIKVGKCVEMVAELPQNYAKNPIGNYNFARRNFYQGISASGYAVSPVYETECEGKTSAIEKYRTELAESINKMTTPDAAAIIKALSIGDKTSITKETFDAYKTSGLAHVLAISGMHMGMIALLVFFLTRVTLAPLSVGRYDLRKPAAVVSLMLTLAYFLISGQSVSCLRAFITTSIILVAILLNRRPISLRLWGLALLIVVSIMPDAVVTPGFLMSFAAVLGIVSFYEKNSTRIAQWFMHGNMGQKVGKYFLGVVITDLVASLMTLPYSIYYFHQISVYTSLGNLLAGPLIAFWIMPALLIFLISYPLGLSYYCIKPLAQGIDVLSKLTMWVSSLSGAESGEGISLMPDWGIFCITIGLLWLCIWEARWRYLGIIAIIIGMLSLWITPKIDFVFDEGGNTFACSDKEGKLQSTPWHRNKFLIKMWTQQEESQQKDYNYEGLSCERHSCKCGTNIEFGKGWIKYNGKSIDVSKAGYITHKSKKVKYHEPTKRIWDK